MADNSTQGGTDTIRDKDRAGVKTQIVGQDVNIGGASEQLMTASALADGTANPTLPAWAMMGMLFNGTTWDRIRGDTTNGLDVDVTRLPALPAGTNNIGDVDVLTLPGSPAQEHTTAGSPASARLSDGSAFYNTNTAGQLPSALVSGRLDINVGAIGAGLALPIVGNTLAPQTGAWTSATSLNTAVTVSGCGPYGAANVAINVPSTVTAGVISLEVSHDGTTYYPAGSVRIDNSYPENVISLAYAPGINGNRNYLVSLDAFTNIRARLSTVITGSGTVNVAIVVGQQGVEPFVAQRSRKVATYRAVFEATASPHLLANTFAANGRKQFATIHHAATATKTVKLRRAAFALQNNTVAGLISIELRRITAAPATGNPAITPSPVDSSLAAAEATCLSLPTTAGTEGALVSLQAIQAPATVPNDARGLPWLDLLNTSSGVTYDDEAMPPTVRAGVLEGFAITLEHSGASAVNGFCLMEFTEEAP